MSAGLRISCAVMTHPRRAEAARRLAGALPELAPAVVVDPYPEGPPSTLRTSLAAWAAVPGWATHHLVLQDDAEPRPGLVGALTALVGARPEEALSLFCEWGSATATMAALLGCSNSLVTIGLKFVRDDCAQSIAERRSPGSQSRTPTNVKPGPLKALR